TKADYQRYISIIDSEFSGQCSQTKTTFQPSITSDSALDAQAQQTASSLQNTRFYVIGNLVHEAKNSLINNSPIDEIVTEEDAKTLSPASLDEFRKYSDYFSIYFSALTEPSCFAAVGQKLSQTFPSDKYGSATGYKKNSKVITSSCSYGDNASAAIKCATLNEKF
ncbi:MAG: hypothetical protein N3A69_05320, partial [Leptospiraceae bacterium]|nr:hypothetical protein [Leptospiraceae bacterium]